MNNKKIIITSILIIVLIIVFSVILINKDNDALKFKKEYESLNGSFRKNDGEKYNDIKISKDNPIKYISVKEALEILEEDKAIIYIGASWCPWCRNAVPVLFEVAKYYKVDTVYYLELDDEKSLFEIKDDELVKTVNGTKEYYKLLDKLSERLDDYELKDENGKVFNTNEKRIYMPYVIGIKSGRVVSDHVGTVKLNGEQNKYSTLTELQKEELKEIYSSLFKDVYGEVNGTCDINEVCD